jgi:hypothetical protein
MEISEDKKGEKKINNIQGFLSRFSHIIPRDTLIKETLIPIVQKHLPVDLKKEQITIQGKKIFLSITPLLKQELIFKKENILEELSIAIGEHIITEIL